MGEKVDRLAAKIVGVDVDVAGEVERLSTLAQDQWPVKGQKRWKVSSYVAPGGQVVSNRPRKRKRKKR